MLTFSLLAPALTQEPSYHMPDPSLTPGATIDVTSDDLCASGFRSPARKIPVSVKGQAFSKYSLAANAVGDNVDNLIPTSLGGSNSIKNLWPQPLSGRWNYYLKNKLERRLRKMVCRGELDLKKAQEEIATDWVRAYMKYLGDLR